VWARVVIGVLLGLVGAVFLGQGIGVIHGSVMTGEAKWAVVGAVMLAVGAALLAWAWHLRVGVSR
jgi:hypothetical protein